VAQANTRATRCSRCLQTVLAAPPLAPASNGLTGCCCVVEGTAHGVEDSFAACSKWSALYLPRTPSRVTVWWCSQQVGFLPGGPRHADEVARAQGIDRARVPYFAQATCGTVWGDRRGDRAIRDSGGGERGQRRVVAEAWRYWRFDVASLVARYRRRSRRVMNASEPTVSESRVPARSTSPETSRAGLGPRKIGPHPGRAQRLRLRGASRMPRSDELARDTLPTGRSSGGSRGSAALIDRGRRHSRQGDNSPRIVTATSAACGGGGFIWRLQPVRDSLAACLSSLMRRCVPAVHAPGKVEGTPRASVRGWHLVAENLVRALVPVATGTRCALGAPCAARSLWAAIGE
jgi:hypothetical protein